MPETQCRITGGTRKGPVRPGSECFHAVGHPGASPADAAWQRRSTADWPERLDPRRSARVGAAHANGNPNLSSDWASSGVATVPPEQETGL